MNDESLIFDAESKIGAVAERLNAQKLTDCVVGSKTGGLGTSTDTTLRDEFASAAALSIDILLTLDVHVGVFDPGHGLLVGSHVWSEAVNLGTDEALLDELHSVLTGDSLDLVLGVLARINLDTTLGTAEGHVSDGELEGHQGGQGFNFLQIDVFRVASAALDGKLVGGVLGSIEKKEKDCERVFSNNYK